MTAIVLRTPPALTLRAGPAARRHLQQNGLQARDIRTLPGAAGGPKALGLSGLDQAVFDWLATTPAVRDLVGASIGGWRFACAMQADPAAALARFAANYVAQDYSRQTTRALIYQNWQALLHDTLGPDGLQAILQHPHYRLSLILVRARPAAPRTARTTARRAGAGRRLQHPGACAAAACIRTADMPRRTQHAGV